VLQKVKTINVTLRAKDFERDLRTKIGDIKLLVARRLDVSMLYFQMPIVAKLTNETDETSINPSKMPVQVLGMNE